jgi:hypothetical protein
MGKWLRGAAAVFLVCVITQGCAVPPKRVLSPEARDISGGRIAVVVSGQGEIKPEVNASNIAMATGGGLIPALIDAAITQARMNSAEKTVRVVRDALGSYDFDKRALETSKSTIGSLSWLNVKDVSFTKETSIEKLKSTLAQSSSPQLVVVAYGYTLSSDFSKLGVAASVSIFPKEAAASRMTASDALYMETFSCVSSLPQPASDDDRNAALWAANDGQLARAALDDGLATVSELVVRSLTLTPEAAAALDQGRTVSMAGQRGSLVETSDKGTLLFVGQTGRWIFLKGVPAPST